MKQFKAEVLRLCKRLEDCGIGTVGAYDLIQTLRAIANGEIEADDVDMQALNDDPEARL